MCLVDEESIAAAAAPAAEISAVQQQKEHLLPHQ